MIQDAIYNTMLKREQASVHDRIFAVLVEQFPELVAARPEMAAYHAEHAGRRMPPRAFYATLAPMRLPSRP